MSVFVLTIYFVIYCYLRFDFRIYGFVGIHNGACVLIEQALNRELTYLPCRHHVFELVLKSAFETYWLTSSGPNVLIFNWFKNEWINIDQIKFATGISDPDVFAVIADIKDEMLIFISNYLRVILIVIINYA